MIGAAFRAIGRKILELRIGYYEDILAMIAEQRKNDMRAAVYSGEQLAALRRRLKCKVEQEAQLKTRAAIRNIVR